MTSIKEETMLVKDWSRVMRIGYSTLAFYALAFVTIAPDLIYSLTGIDTNPTVWGRLALIIIVLGLIGRIIDQPEQSKWKRRGIVAFIIIAMCAFSAPAIAHETPCNQITAESFDDLAFEFIAEGEGKRNAAYLDLVSVPTICYGSTRGVKLGQYKTDAECRSLLIAEISEYKSGLYEYFTEETKSSRLTVRRSVAYTSLAYNVGIRGAGKSTATRRLNRGDIKGGCEAITWWNRAGNRVVRGLVIRRAKEAELCLAGLS